IAGKQWSTRRRSTRTTAPTAPLASSSHMNQNRDWPGVPNRYRISCSSTVMRPKSMATVVVVLSGTMAVSSTPTDSAVMCCSVVRGGISEIAPTKVVLPAPNPPATRALSGMSSRGAGGGGRGLSTRTESIEQPSQDDVTGAAIAVAGPWQVDIEVAAVGQVTDEHPGHPHRHLEGGADLGQRLGPGAHLDDRPRLHLQRRRGGERAAAGGDDGLQGQLLAVTAGPAPGDGVDRHHPVGVPALVGAHRAIRSPGSEAAGSEAAGSEAAGSEAAGSEAAGRRAGVSMCPT